MAARLGGEPGGARRVNGRVMATSARYFDLVREMKDAYNHRLRLVESAKRIGINPVQRQLVSHAKEWPWSSWSFYKRGESGLIQIDALGAEGSSVSICKSGKGQNPYPL